LLSEFFDILPSRQHFKLRKRKLIRHGFQAKKSAKAAVIYVIAPSIWVLIDLPLRADFSPAHPTDFFAIDLPNVPVARARAIRSPTVVLGEWPRLPFTARI
jgi:hypothetical protein